MINRVFFQGNLTRDPVAKDSGAVRFGIAINERRKGEESAMFLECVTFDRTAEIVMSMTGKGTQVFVEGRLQQSRWTGRDGKQKSELQVVAERVQVLSRGKTPEREPEPVGAGIGEDDFPF